MIGTHNLLLRSGEANLLFDIMIVSKTLNFILVVILRVVL